MPTAKSMLKSHRETHFSGTNSWDSVLSMLQSFATQKLIAILTAFTLWTPLMCLFLMSCNPTDPNTSQPQVGQYISSSSMKVSASLTKLKEKTSRPWPQ